MVFVENYPITEKIKTFIIVRMDSEWLLGPPVLMGDRVAWLGPEEPLLATVRWLGRLPEVFPQQMVAGISLVTLYAIIAKLSVSLCQPTLAFPIKFQYFLFYLLPSQFFRIVVQ